MEESTEFIEETQVKETQEETQVKELRRRVYELESANKELAEKVEHLKEEKNKIYGWWKEGENIHKVLAAVLLEVADDDWQFIVERVVKALKV